MRKSLTSNLETIRFFSLINLKRTNYIVALLVLFLCFSNTKSFGQNDGETIWGEGIMTFRDAVNSNSLKNMPVFIWPDSMGMIVPDTVYEYETSINGAIFINLPVYIDTTTTSVKKTLKNSGYVFPNYGSEMNVFFTESQTGHILFCDMKGNKVFYREFSTDHLYLNLSELKRGLYVYQIECVGFSANGKYLKQSAPLKGPCKRPEIRISQKATKEEYEARYWVKWVPEQGQFSGHFTDSSLMLLHEGDNGWLPFYVEPVPGIPQHQDITGVIQNGDDDYSLMPGVDVRLINETTDDTLFAVTGSDGSFVFEDCPLENDYLFSAGNVSGMGSLKNVPYTTPEEVEIPEDTINDHFDVVLKYIPATTTPQHIKDQTSHGTRQQVVEYYLDDSFTSTQKNTIRGYFEALEGDENSFDYEESLVPLNNTGINIEYGTYNTQAHSEWVTTPLGHTLYPVLYANSTMHPGSYVSFVHEIKRAIGLAEVGWPNAYSVMETPAQQYTLEDRHIGEFEREYWNSVYQDEKTWIDLNYISDGF